MLLRANTLAKGHSGARLETLETLLELLNRQVHPVVPAKGSVGASGDLAPLSHAALVVMGEGMAEYQGRVMDGRTALSQAGLEPVQLASKEGLALNNGTQFMTAIGALAVYDAGRLLDTATVAAALTLEALEGITDSFDARVHRVRPHPGAMAIASRIESLTAGSRLLRTSQSIGPHDPRGPQDPYSLRAIPPVMGSGKDLIEFARTVVAVEMNSATDDPLFFDGDPVVLYCCNFHGQPVAAALDVLGIGVTTIGNVAERRIALLIDEHHNRGLPAFLVHPKARPGANTG
jgi:histidine ammonia-lyase